MRRPSLERLKDEAWKAGVLASRPLVTVREGFRDAVFDTIGVEVLDESWDVLVVLDACRADLFRSVAADYGLLDGFDTAFSKASSSREWLTTNFRTAHRSEMERTTLVTGNPFTDAYLDEDDFRHLDEVWRYAWDDEVGTVPPKAITDRGIATARKHDPERLILHYMQPHFPAFSDQKLGSAVNPEENVWIDSVWDQLRAGEVDHDRVWSAYEANLRHVLDSLESFLSNADADTVVITADHGNGFGEEGIYGHPRLRTHRVLREVPWVRTSATDEETYDPGTERAAETEDVVQERLRDLGYA